MNPRDDSGVRFSLLHLFGVTSFVAFALAVVSQTGSILLGIHLSLALTGWVAWRFLHGHPFGLIPALLGVDLLLCSSVDWIQFGTDDCFGIRGMANLVFTMLVLGGMGVQVWIAAKRQQYWQHQLAIAVLIFAVLTAWWVVVPTVGDAAIARRRASDIVANNRAAAKAIVLVEDVRQRTGRTPDADELNKLLREPLPSVRWSGLTLQITYQRTGDKTYQLSYVDPSIIFGDILLYDSDVPEKGWIRIPW